jgi:hypothetical protein
VVTSKAAQLDRAMMLRTGNAEKRHELGSVLRGLVDETVGRPVDAGLENLAEVTNARHWAAQDLQRYAELERDFLAAATDRDRIRGVVWPREAPSDVDLPRIEKLANRVVRTHWRWLRSRRARKFREFSGITDPGIGAAQVIAWCRAEREFAHSYQELRHFLGTRQGDLLGDFERTDVRWRHASERQLRELVRRGVTSGAELLTRLSTALTEDEPRRDLMMEALGYAKGWATSTLSTRPNFRCAAATIDLVVIDEASQCSLAQVLPLACRAKRLVIVGDPRQLPPVVTADPGQLRWLAEQAGIQHQELATRCHTYGEDSAFSAFAARFRPGPLLLDEHYRCHPDIIRFCNEEFYRNQLKILTSVEYPATADRGIGWIEVAGVTEPGRTGSVINEPEARAIVDWLVNADPTAVESIGVVTPFRAQANLIERLLNDAGIRSVEVGTAHTFQGGERDTMLFSTVVSRGVRTGTVGWLESQRNLVNVAVSRAKRRLVVFGNYGELREHGPNTLRALARAAQIPASAPAVSAGSYIQRLHAALTAQGIPAKLGQVAEGYPIAIAVTGRSGTLIDVEVSEFPDGDSGGGLQRALAVRDGNLRALGWQILRVPASQVYLDADQVVRTVLQAAHTGAHS